MRTFNDIQNELANSQEWDKKVSVFCPVLTHGLNSNIKVYETEIFETIEDAEEKAREMIDEGFTASNSFPARDYATQRIEITAQGYDFKELSAYNIYK